jgi:hypothetical protein
MVRLPRHFHHLNPNLCGIVLNEKEHLVCLLLSTEISSRLEYFSNYYRSPRPLSLQYTNQLSEAYRLHAWSAKRLSLFLHLFSILIPTPVQRKHHSIAVLSVTQRLADFSPLPLFHNADSFIISVACLYVVLVLPFFRLFAIYNTYNVPVIMTLPTGTQEYRGSATNLDNYPTNVSKTTCRHMFIRHFR